jgi:hypothetical protein
MKKSLLLLLSLTLFACQADAGKMERIPVSGDLTTRSETLDTFSSIVVAGPIDLVIEQDGGSTINVETYESIMERFRAVVVDEVLYLYLHDSTASKKIHIDDEHAAEIENALISGSRIRWPRGKKILKVRVSFENIEALAVIGESDITSRGLWKTDRLKMDVAGAMHLSAEEMDIKHFSVDIAGAANLELSGKAGVFEVDCAGAGTIKAYDFLVRDVSLDVAGVCNAQVYAAGSITVNIAGLGNVRYKGDPPVVNIEKAGMGRIRQAEDEKVNL